MIFLTWVSIVFGLISPIFLFALRKKHQLINFLFFFTPLSTVFFVIVGSLENDYLLYENTSLALLLYIIAVAEMSIILLYLMFYLSVDGISFIGRDNDWSRLGIKYELFALLLFLLMLLILPHPVFGMMYSLWGIIMINDFYISFADSLYFSFSLIYGIPLPETLANFQEQIGTITVLRYVQMVHVFSATILEYIVIGFIIGKVASVIQKKLAANP
ncbi:hypothetical protein ABEW34_21680 [Paenibacillus algorifonticola]|uniref:hypothetical protein n=1 Tax=Paenibacillus algorifonticola TaxID=684063 RepID=UPI003D2B6B6E